MKLYKYYPLSEYSKKVITHQEIFFSPFKSLNDPFEIAVHYHFDCDQKMKESFFEKSISTFKDFQDNAKKEYIQSFEKQQENNNGRLLFFLRDSFKDSGVFCLTEDPMNILMWSHYSRNHRGFCVEFDTDKDPLLQTAFQVNYEPEFQQICYYDNYTIKDVLNKKFKIWEYEREWRLADAAHGIKQISKDAITKIYLGGLHRFIPKEEDDTYGDFHSYFEVIKLAHEHLPHVKFQNLRISNSKYALEEY